MRSSPFLTPVHTGMHVAQYDITRIHLFVFLK